MFRIWGDTAIFIANFAIVAESESDLKHLHKKNIANSVFVQILRQSNKYTNFIYKQYAKVWFNVIPIFCILTPNNKVCDYFSLWEWLWSEIL